MPERVRRFGAILFLAFVVTAGLAVASDEGELLRRIKSDVFDRNWPAVLSECDEFIKSFPRSQALPRAYYYRAQALESLKRPKDAMVGYTEFLKRFPGETGALREDAKLKRITLARVQYQNADKTAVNVILEGMDEEDSTQIYAAIEGSKIDHIPARKKATPILKDCAQFETQEELKSECVVGLLRIDPKLAQGLNTGPGAPVAGQARLIRVEVFNKLQKKVVVRINLPLAFGELLLDAFDENYRKLVLEKLQQEHGAEFQVPDLKKLLEAIKTGGPQTLVEIDNEEDSIKVWIE